MKRMLPAAALIVAAAIGPAVAIWVPQTRAEFVKAVARGEGATAMQTFVVERDFAEVYAVLRERSGVCLDVEVRRSGYVGTHMERSSSDYNPTIRRSASGKGEFTLQVVHRPRGVGHTPPPGGLYVMAADLRALGRGRTEIVLYHPTIGFKKIVNAFKGWADGGETDCPKLR